MRFPIHILGKVVDAEARVERKPDDDDGREDDRYLRNTQWLK